MAKRNGTSSKKIDNGIIAGVLVLALGVLFLLNNTLGIDVAWHKYWPLVLIVVGLYMLLDKLGR